MCNYAFDAESLYEAPGTDSLSETYIANSTKNFKNNIIFTKLHHSSQVNDIMT